MISFALTPPSTDFGHFLSSASHIVKMHIFSAVLSLALIIGSSASPAPFPNANPPPSATCQLVSAVISSLKSCATPTPFCSSFLSIPHSTTTVTKTATVAATVTQSAITGTKTITAAPITVASVATETITACTPDVGGDWDKRDLGKRNAPTTKSTSTTSPTVTTTCTIPGIRGTLNCAAISTACQCLSIPTSTATVTATAKVTAVVTVTAKLAATTTVTPTKVIPTIVTITQTACPTPDTSCGNLGTTWGQWSNTQDPSSPAWSDFDPTRYKSDAAEFKAEDIIDEISDQAGDDVVMQRTYLFAPLDGDYTISIDRIGNTDLEVIALIWFGPVAYSGWNRQNALLTRTSADGLGNATVTLAAGKMYPIRLMYAYTSIFSGLTISIHAPDGTKLAGTGIFDIQYLLQCGCGAEEALYPPYAPWNAES